MKTFCFISGVHRSGTSTAGAMVGCFGFGLGNAALPGNDQDNPGGYYENLDIVRFNDSIFAGLGLRWDSLLIGKCIYQTPLADRRAEAETVLRDNFGESRKALVKDPRLAISLDLWCNAAKSVFPEMIEKHVLVLRDPRGVVASLRRRTNKGVVPFQHADDEELSYLFWIFNIVRILQQVAGKEALFVNFSDQNSRAGRKRIFDRLSEYLDCPADPKRVKWFETEFFSGGTRKGDKGLVRRSRLRGTGADAMEIYNLLRDEHMSPQAVLDAGIVKRHAMQLALICRIARGEVITSLTELARSQSEIRKFAALNSAADMIWGRATAEQLAKLLTK